MRFLGRLHGTLVCGEETIGPADFDLDGFKTRPGEVVAWANYACPRQICSAPPAGAACVS
jgi:hypothetical protein